MDDEQTQFLDDAMAVALDALDREPDIMKIAEPLRTVALVTAAQAALDNGGLSYFFEADFWHHQPYAVIIHAYRLCGAAEAANVLEEALSFFPFDQLHLKIEQRREVLEVLGRDEQSRYLELSHMICGDERVYVALAAYARRYDSLFPAQKPRPDRRGECADDEGYCKSVLEIQEQYLGRDHPNVAATLDDLAAIYARTNRVAEAEALLKRAHGIRGAHAR